MNSIGFLHFRHVNKSKYSHPKQIASCTTTYEVTTCPIYHYFKAKFSEITWVISKAWQEGKVTGLSVVFQVCFNTPNRAEEREIPSQQCQLQQKSGFSPSNIPFLQFSPVCVSLPENITSQNRGWRRDLSCRRSFIFCFTQLFIYFSA